MTNYPDGFTHSVKFCERDVECQTCGQPFPARGTEELGDFYTDEDTCPDCKERRAEERGILGRIAGMARAWIAGAATELAGKIAEDLEAEGKDVLEDAVCLEVLKATEHCLGADNDNTKFLRGIMRMYVFQQRDRVEKDLEGPA